MIIRGNFVFPITILFVALSLLYITYKESPQQYSGYAFEKKKAIHVDEVSKRKTTVPIEDDAQGGKMETNDLIEEEEEKVENKTSTNIRSTTPQHSSPPITISTRRVIGNESTLLSNAKYFFADFHASKYGGGVGNFMFEWVSFHGIARALNRMPALHVRNDMVGLMLKWQKSFPNILDKTNILLMRNEKSLEISYSGCCRYVDFRPSHVPHSQVPAVFARLVYVQSFYYFKDIPRNELLEMLFFHESDKKVAREEMIEAKYNINSTHNVCVHIRRGDFVNSTLHHPSTEEFTGKAIRFGVSYAQNRTAKTVAVVLLGNDPDWEQNLIKSMGPTSFAIHVVKHNPKYWVPHVDWIFAQLYCDTVVLTASASTYGWWLGYVSRGDSVLYNAQYSAKGGVEREFDEEKFWPPHWIRIRQNNVTKSINIEKR